MENIGKVIVSQKARKYIYGVIIAVIPLLMYIGIIDDNEAQLYSNIAASVLAVSGFSLAIANTPKSKTFKNEALEALDELSKKVDANTSVQEEKSVNDESPTLTGVIDGLDKLVGEYRERLEAITRETSSSNTKSKGKHLADGLALYESRSKELGK